MTIVSLSARLFGNALSGTIIMSLILRSTPDEVKLILIDPKKVEMLPYANMPHLLCPVVIDPKKANNALKKVVVEMDRRYELFANNGVRNIDAYNNVNSGNKLYKLVVIIDELADLMLACSKEVEESIQRITQLARAAGIYLIVATQRPSVDVITGVIKANIPSRIAFSVSSQVDSRTILDKAGAEDLLGKGDMLMDISGSSALNRVQGVLVDDDEIFKVVRKVKEKYEINFNEEFLNLEDDKKEVINNLSELENTNNEDSLYNDIKLFVIKNQKASTSLLQRYFSLGYARAARMMDRL
jgi:S-DNA-T family DNA segregation ATPase FtsK/SpoIIIE